MRQIKGFKVGGGGDAVSPGIADHSFLLANAHLHWNDRLGRMVVHVTRDAVTTDEITAKYLDYLEGFFGP